MLPERILFGGAVLIEGHAIVSVLERGQDFSDKDTHEFDFGTDFIMPGFIDIHLHGAMGKDVMDADSESLEILTAYQARQGVTGFLGATMAADVDSVLAAVEKLKTESQRNLPSEILGVYLEGPFINIQKKGAQNPAYDGIWKREDIERLFACLRGKNAIIPVAPEIPLFMGLIEEIITLGFIPAIGHSAASYKTAIRSFQAGISHATHLFNASGEFHHREPGVVGAVLDSESVTAEIIADGVHVHPATIRLALACKGEDGICLVTDSVRVSGLGDGIFPAGDRQVSVDKDRAVLKETDTLAGGVISMGQAIKNMRHWCGLEIPQAVKMASLNPARLLGQGNRIGSLEEGKLANLAVLDENFNVKRTVIRGKEVYSLS